MPILNKDVVAIEARRTTEHPRYTLALAWTQVRPRPLPKASSWWEGLVSHSAHSGWQLEVSADIMWLWATYVDIRHSSWSPFFSFSHRQSSAHRQRVESFSRFSIFFTELMFQCTWQSHSQGSSCKSRLDSLQEVTKCIVLAQPYGLLLEKNGKLTEKCSHHWVRTRVICTNVRRNANI